LNGPCTMSATAARLSRWSSDLNGWLTSHRPSSLAAKQQTLPPD
jgi:hypothetical protein